MSNDSEAIKGWGECEAQNQQLREELERVKKERDELEEVNGQLDRKYHEDGETIDGLRTELAEKNNVLSFYADDLTYDIDHLSKYGYIIIDKDAGIQARSILAQYKAVSHET